MKTEPKSKRIHDTNLLQVGSITNKGTVEVIYNSFNVLIDGMYYDTLKHKIALITALNK